MATSLHTECGVAFPKPFPKQALVFTSLQHKSLGNTVGKREIARNEQVLLLYHCFLPILITFYQILSILSNLKMSSASSFSLEESKIFRLGKG